MEELNNQHEKDSSSQESQEPKQLISRFEAVKLARGFDNFPLILRKVFATPPEVYEILGRAYTEENQYLKTIEQIDANIYKIGFEFSNYKSTRQVLHHVSGVQMKTARFQALIVAILLAIKNEEITSELSYDICLTNLYNMLHREEHIIYRNMVSYGEKAYIVIQVGDVQKRGRSYYINCSYPKEENREHGGFLEGKDTCVLLDKHIAVDPTDNEKFENQMPLSESMFVPQIHDANRGFMRKELLDPETQAQKKLQELEQKLLLYKQEIQRIQKQKKSLEAQVSR